MGVLARLENMVHLRQIRVDFVFGNLALPHRDCVIGRAYKLCCLFADFGGFLHNLNARRACANDCYSLALELDMFGP